MKNKMVIGVLATGLVFGGALAVGATNNDKVTSQKVTENKEMISVEKAKEIVLTKAEGYVESLELESYKDNYYYDVEIEGKKDYDIINNAYTGEVLSVEEENDDNDDDRDEASRSSNQKLISEQEAISIAEKLVNGTMIEIELDEDDNRFIYELELKTSQGEAEVEIDAVTGEVLESELDD